MSELILRLLCEELLRVTSWQNSYLFHKRHHLPLDKLGHPIQADEIDRVFSLHRAGPARARGLRPAAFLFVQRPLPAYECDLDHACLIASLDKECLTRGEVIYR